MKKLISILAVLAISVSSFSALAFPADAAIANPGIIAQPNSDYVYSVDSYIDKTGSKSVLCTSEVDGKSGVTRIMITQTLQKKATSDSWAKAKDAKIKTFYSDYASYPNSYDDLYSGTYRTKTVAQVYKGSSYETITRYSSSVII